MVSVLNSIPSSD